jgi:hypothetical protein
MAAPSSQSHHYFSNSNRAGNDSHAGNRTRPLILAKDLISVTSADSLIMSPSLALHMAAHTCGSWRLAGLGAVDELLGSVTHLVHQHAEYDPLHTVDRSDSLISLFLPSNLPAVDSGLVTDGDIRQLATEHHVVGVLEHRRPSRTSVAAWDAVGQVSDLPTVGRHSLHGAEQARAGYVFEVSCHGAP